MVIQEKSEISANVSQQKIERLFANDGLLSLHLKGFEPRIGQKEMALDVFKAFEEDKVALIEAGTGIGKSFAYLIPALLWAEKTQERIVISTNTIALQEQLIEKDIPFALKMLNLSMKVVLVKGMRNYACLRKLDEEMTSRSLFQDESSDEISEIHEWSKHTKIGSRSELSFFPTAATWEKVGVDPDACTNQECPFFKECFFFSARKETYDAKILVCNHHLLFADLAAKIEKGNEGSQSSGVLPSYQRLIIDEAHHVEDVACEYFADKVSRLELLKILSQLASDSEKTQGKLVVLKKRVHELPETAVFKQADGKTRLLNTIEFDLAAARRETFSYAQEFFNSLISFLSFFPLQKNDEAIQTSEQKLRLKEVHIAHPLFKEGIIPQKEKLYHSLDALSVALQNLEIDLENVKNDRFQEVTKGLRVDIQAIASKLYAVQTKLTKFFSMIQDDQKIRWLEVIRLSTSEEVRLISSEFDISKELSENLFQKLATTVLCSATLATQKRFDYIKSRLGIDTLVKEKIKLVSDALYESPFPYKTNALLGVPSDMPLPDQPFYLKACVQAIYQLVKVSRGNAFILFTSYSMLTSCYAALAEKLESEGYNLLKHGDDHRRELLRRFKEKPKSILFGTDSFWEGVDVIGEALRLVIIVKLPFQVPTEPLIEARTEAITRQGGFPFMEYLVPKAVVKFKQAFGRLIRHKDDRGSVVCLDARLLKKNYGKEFIHSLPECYQVFEPLETLLEKMRTFYR